MAEEHTVRKDYMDDEGKDDVVRDDVVRMMEEIGVVSVQLQFTDMHGMIKSTGIPFEEFKQVLDRDVWFDGSSIEGFARIAESDMLLKPDISTYSLLPWENSDMPTARFICDCFAPDHSPFEADPRGILKRAVKKAEEIGFVYNVGPELEFFLFKADELGVPAVSLTDHAGYFDYAGDFGSNVRKESMVVLRKMGIPIVSEHHEVAGSQHEIDFKYADALRAADTVITLKQAVKSVAAKHGLHASFMPKPLNGENGSGMHVHQSLFGHKNGKNAFFDADDEYSLSETAKHFIAGQMENIVGICAVTSPTVNSYKRLVPGYEAPVYICWARQNRSALIRIPSYSEGREESVRAELRCPDPSCNPYLAFAVMLEAGLDGIGRQLALCSPVEEDVYDMGSDMLSHHNIRMLPGSLDHAIAAMEKSHVARSALGEHAFNVYIEAKKAEWDEYRQQVTGWEISRYLETS